MDADGRYNSQQLPPENPFAPLEPADDHATDDQPIASPVFKFGSKEATPKSEFNLPKATKRPNSTRPDNDESTPAGDGYGTRIGYRGSAPPIFNNTAGPNPDDALFSVFSDASHPNFRSGSAPQIFDNSFSPTFGTAPNQFSWDAPPQSFGDLSATPLFSMPDFEIPAPMPNNASCAKCDNLFVEYNIVCDQLATQKVIAEHAQKKTAELEKKMAQLEKEAALAALAEVERQATISELQQDIDQTNTLWSLSRVDANNEIDELQKVIEFNNSEIEKLNDEIEVKEKEIEDRDQTIVNSYDKFKRQEEALNALRKADKQHQEKARVKDNEITRLIAEIGGIREQLGTEKVRAAELLRGRHEVIKNHEAKGKMKDEEITQLKSQCNEASSQLNSVKAQAEAAIQKRETTISGYQEREQIKDQQIAQLQDQYSNASNEYVTLKMQVDAAVPEYDKMIKDYQAGERAKDQKLSQLQAQYDDISSRYSSLKVEAETLDRYHGKEEDYDVKENARNQHVSQLQGQYNSLVNNYNVLKTKAEKDVEQRDVKIKDQEKELAVMKTTISTYREQEEMKDRQLSRLQSQYDDSVHLKTQAERQVQQRDTKIKDQKKELTDMGTKYDDDWERAEATNNELNKELIEMKRKFQEAEGKGKMSVSNENELQRIIEDQGKKIKKDEQVMDELRRKIQDIKAEAREQDMEKEEVNLLAEKQMESQGSAAKRIEQLTEMYEKKISNVKKELNWEHAEELKALEQEMALFQEANDGVTTDVEALRVHVEERSQKVKDLQDEVNALKKASPETKFEVVDEKPPSNELVAFSPPLSPTRKPRGFFGKQRRVWYSSSEDEDKEPIKARSRRRRTSSPAVPVPKSDSATQTDVSPITTKPAMQSIVVSKPATTDVAAQTEADSSPDVADQAVQTIPVHDTVVNTSSTASQKVSPWRHLLYWLLLLLVMAMLVFAVFYEGSARRERMMWLNANDYPRRAVMSMGGSGGTGTKVPAWLWKEPLIEVSSRYY